MDPKIKEATGKDIFVRGDALVLVGMFTRGAFPGNIGLTKFRWQGVVIDRIMPKAIHPEMLTVRDDFILSRWEEEYEAEASLARARARTILSSKGVPIPITKLDSGLLSGLFYAGKRKDFFKPVNRIRYLIANTNDNNQKICNGVLEKTNPSPTQWEYNGFNCTVTKVGSVYDWDVEELLTNEHHEIRKIGKQRFAQ